MTDFENKRSARQSAMPMDSGPASGILPFSYRVLSYRKRERADRVADRVSSRSRPLSARWPICGEDRFWLFSVGDAAAWACTVVRAVRGVPLPNAATASDARA